MINFFQRVIGDISASTVEVAPASVPPKKFSPNQGIQIGICIQYNIGSFQIENIAQQFDALDPEKAFLGDLDNKIDLIVSRFTLLHLIDGAGLIVEIYNKFLRSGGYILSDGFYLGFPEEDCVGRIGISAKITVDSQTDFDHALFTNLFYFLLSLNTPFVLGDSKHSAGSGAFSQFLLYKPDNKKLSPPLSYDGVLSHPYYCHIGESSLATYKKSNDLTINILKLPMSGELTGDPALVHFLIKSDVMWEFDFSVISGTIMQEESSRRLAKKFYPLETFFDIHPRITQTPPYKARFKNMTAEPKKNPDDPNPMKPETR